jgi:hypothetical protein
MEVFGLEVSVHDEGAHVFPTVTSTGMDQSRPAWILGSLLR